ncbi:MAG: zf-HC2 domain-containing protein [Butyrivibrio sp.]
MKCMEFQKLIPDIINGTVDDEHLEDVIGHLESCRECYDELEINYILQYGLSDDDSAASMDYVGQLERNLSRMKKRLRGIELYKSVSSLINISAYTAVAGAFIYVLFKYFI